MIDRAERRTNEYLSLGLLLFLVAAVASTIVTSCGSGGGDSNGGLCEQCGDDPDGPCQETVDLSGPNAQAICGEDTCEDVELFCLRELGSSQRRCFPLDDNPEFECDGARPNPATRTPGPAATPTSTGGATPNPANCGNGVIDFGEECDGLEHGGQTCATLCVAGSGPLSCSACEFDTSLCQGECL